MILGITPARGGSKRIPRKNIKFLAGKPLIVWTIEAARQSGRLDRYVVSTEDAEIAQAARVHGAEILARPEALAGDTVATLPVLQHALRETEADILVVLQATSPVRDPGLIDRCIERFVKSGADSLATGFICKSTEYGTHSLRRQEIPGFFYDDGNLYVIRADLIRRGERYGKNIERMLIDREQNIEIDDPFDFWLAEQILNKRLQTARKEQTT